MDIVVLVILVLSLLGLLFLFFAWSYREKALMLAPAAKKIGLQNRTGNWFTGVRFSGKQKNLDVILKASFEKNRDILTLILELPSSQQLEIRRTRDFLNFDFTSWVFGHYPPKLNEFSDKDFEVFSDDAFLVRRIFSNSYIKPLLELCIANQSDSLIIQRTQFRLKHEVISLSDDETLELELNGMLELMNAIYQLLNKPILKPETLICPFCHDHLMNERDVVQCEICSALHHQACWNENTRRCAVFECTGSIGSNLQLKS